MFKDIDINSKSELEPYFKLVDYEASEYCFSTIYMWRHLFNTKCYIENDFAIILLEYEKNVFSIIPLCTKDKLLYVIDFSISNPCGVYIFSIVSPFCIVISTHFSLLLS